MHFNEKFKLPETASILVLTDCAVVFTQIDYQKLEGRVKFFPSVREAQEWILAVAQGHKVPKEELDAL